MIPDRPAEHPEDLIGVARIARPQGLRGEVVADLLTDFPERFARLKEVRLKLASGEIVVRRLERFRPHQGRIVLKFEECASIEEAELLRGASVLITREQLVPLPADTYYDFDLVGCLVVTVGGEELGRVVDVQNFGAAPLLVVEGEGSRELLIPLATSICAEIDVRRQRIVVDPPEGLLD